MKVILVIKVKVFSESRFESPISNFESLFRLSSPNYLQTFGIFKKLKYEDIHGLDWVNRPFFFFKDRKRLWVSEYTVRSSLFRQILGF